jgi:hypothetical protein
VLRGVAIVAKELERHFPADGAAEQNELPDVVDTSLEASTPSRQ